MNNFRWLIFSFVIVSIGVFMFTIGKVSLAVMNPEAVDSKAKINTETIEVFSGLKLTTETKKAETYEVINEIPTTENDEINQTILNWVEEQENSFYDALEETNDDETKDEFIPQFNLQTELIKVTDDMYSFVLVSQAQFSEDHKESNVNSFTINLAKEEFVSLDSIIKQNKATVHKISQIAEQQLNEKIDGEKLTASLAKKDDWTWSLNENDFRLHLTSNDQGRDDSKVYTVNIPYKKITAHLTDSFLISTGLEVPVTDKNGKYVALTFDDGPDEEVTPRVLAALEEYGATATFFMIGNKVKANPDLAKKVADAGHEVANHSVTHANLTTLGVKGINNEINVTSEHIHQATSQSSMLFRPPYGAINDRVIKIAEENNQTIIMWSVDTQDWKNHNPNLIHDRIMTSVTPGAIILLHDIHGTTADALPRVLQSLIDEGYEFISVSQLLDLYELDGVGPHFSGE